MEICQNRAIRSTRQVEYHDLHCNCVISTLAHMATYDCVADVQPMFWKPHLVPHALRPSHARYPGSLGLLLPCAGSYNQHPADENIKYGPQRTGLGIAYVLLFVSSRTDLREFERSTSAGL